MKPAGIVSSLMIATAVLAGVAAEQQPAQNWTSYVRIAAYGLKSGNAEAIVRDAQSSRVYGIEVDNDIPGRYESFVDPREKLAAIRGGQGGAWRGQ